MIIPKVSTDQQGFSGTFTHMDGMMKNQREKERKTERDKRKTCQTITSVRRCKTWITCDKSTGLKKTRQSKC